MSQSAQQIPAIIQSLAPIIDSYGYIAVGTLIFVEDFGIPAPGETVLITAAFFAGLGHLNIILVMIIGFLGAVLGDNVGYAIGRYGGRSLVERFGKYVFITPARLDKLGIFFKKYGTKVVVVARFVEGLRQVNGIMAGLSDMRWPKFITFNVIGAALWVGVWGSIGYYGGGHIDVFLRYQLYFTIVVFIAIAVFLITKFLKHKKSSDPI
ncbi:MAG: DedA family protein [Candidatus Saccharimonadales bacterium]